LGPTEERKLLEEHSRLTMEQEKLQEECGRLVIEADEREYLPAIPELRELIRWHTGDGSGDAEPGKQAVRVRCPYMLFLDVAGGHRLQGWWANGKWTTDEDEKKHGTARCGGLIPEREPATLRLSASERYAVACEWLAELIERRAATPFIPAETPQEAFCRFCYEEIMKGKRTRKEMMAEARKNKWTTSHDEHIPRRMAEKYAEAHKDLPPLPAPKRGPKPRKGSR
jgi:hypothetical protein